MASKKQVKYAEARGKGLSREQSAIVAGYAENTDDKNLTRIEKNPTVQEELARIRADTAKNTGITKEQVTEMFMTAANMAKMTGDVAGLVAAAREIGKMLGFYAPEVKKTLHDVDKDSLRAAMAQMSDEDLLRIANARIIDGESKRIK